MNGKFCMFSSFMMGAAAGYMYHDYMLSNDRHGRKGDLPMPKCMMRKAKKLKKDMLELWDDIH